MAGFLIVEDKFDFPPRYEIMDHSGEATIRDPLELNEKSNFLWEKYELETTVHEINLPTTGEPSTVSLARITDFLRETAKIELTDDLKTVRDKILEIPIPETHTGYTTFNPALDILRTILIPLSLLRLSHLSDEVNNFPADAFTTLGAPEGTLFTIEVAIWCFGECVNKHYRTYEEIERDWGLGRIGEEDLKLAVARSLCCVLEGVRGRV